MNKWSSVTVHMLVKNEENFVFFAVRSVIDIADHLIIYDTWSTDNTVSKIRQAISWFETKVTFEEKGSCTRNQHTELRQEMIERTKTEWFMIVDGDEIYHEDGVREIRNIVNCCPKEIDCLMVPFYLCVWDIYHSSKLWKYTLFEQTGHFSVRLCKIKNWIHWSWAYNQDTLIDGEWRQFFQKENSLFIKMPYWHVSHLRRSPLDAYSSNWDSRIAKEKLFYFLIGERIRDSIPKVFWDKFKGISRIESVFNFIKFTLTWSTKKCMKLFGKSI